MCLVVKKSTKERVIDEDLVVYKAMYVDSSGIKTYHRDHPYTLNALYTTSLERESFNLGDLYSDSVSLRYYRDTPNLDCYNEGFHSYKTISRLNSCYLPSKCVAVRCIIPKGSTIVEDETGLIVSDQIIIKELLA